MNLLPTLRTGRTHVWICVQCDEQLDHSCFRQHQFDEAYTANFIDPSTAQTHQCPKETCSESVRDSAQSAPCSRGKELGSSVLRDTPPVQKGLLFDTELEVEADTLGDRSPGLKKVGAGQGSAGAETSAQEEPSGREGAIEPQQTHNTDSSESTIASEEALADLQRSHGHAENSWWPIKPSPKADVPKPPFHYNMSEAALIADLQSAVYCHHDDLVHWNCTRCQGSLLGFEIHRSIVLYDWDLTAFVGYWPLFDAVFAVFRGTDSKSISNWVANLDAHRRVYTIPGVPQEQLPEMRGSPYVHAGFYRSLFKSTLYLQVRAALRVDLLDIGNKPLYLVGHSLGASMAALAAPMLKYELKPPIINLYTFGCPRTGNLGYSDLLMASVNNSVRFTHGADIVPSVPLPDWGFFHHFPTEVWQTDPPASAMHDHQACTCEQRLKDRNVEDSTFHVCDDTGEDPSCHDSMCYYRPCTSASDHLHYLGRPMYHSTEEC